VAQFEHLWFEFWDVFRNGVAHIHYPLVGVVIALLAGLIVRGIFNLFIVAALAVVVQVVAEAAIPAVMNKAPLVFPPMTHAFFQYALALYAGYFVVILAIYIVRLLFVSVSV
jgi:hypothetical protein